MQAAEITRPETRFQNCIEGRVEYLVKALRFVKHAIGDREASPNVRGVCFDIDDESLHVVATDLFRLAHTRIPYKTPGRPCRFAITKEAALSILSKFKTKKSMLGKRFRVDLSAHLLIVDGETFEGRTDYPDWRIVLPKDPESIWTFDRETVHEVVDVFATMGKGICRKIKVRSNEAGDVEFESAQRSHAANFKTTAALTGQTVHKQFEIGVNAKFVADALQSFLSIEKGHTVELAHPGVANTPLKFFSGVDRESFVVVMPLRV